MTRAFGKWFVLAGLLLIATATAWAEATPNCGAPPNLNDGWPASPPEQQGLDAALVCAIGPRVEAWQGADVHAVVVIRHGALVYENYFAGEDQKWGKPLGRVSYNASMVHDLRSVTKSLTSLVVGIAVDRGWIKDLDAPVLSFFPEYADLRNPEKDRITLRHFLMMSTGLAWDESIPYSNPDNSENRLYEAKDPYRFVLERPVADPPGLVFNYVTGAPTVLGAMVHKVTGKPFDAVEKEVLLDPLGITDTEWIHFDNGDPMAGGGLRLRARDLAKIGQLVLTHGAWNGKQVVSADWIAQSTAPRLNAYSMYFYGYQWWLGRSLVDGRQVDWIAGRGYGGQRLFIIPSLDIVMVVMEGHYSTSVLQEVIPVSLLNRNVLPAARAN
jgi:CubicO group peptidase (beta-lactamase class C family)